MLGHFYDGNRQQVLNPTPCCPLHLSTTSSSIQYYCLYSNTVKRQKNRILHVSFYRQKQCFQDYPLFQVNQCLPSRYETWSHIPYDCPNVTLPSSCATPRSFILFHRENQFTKLAPNQ